MGSPAQTLNNYLDKNCWIKQIDYNFDAESYQIFYKSGDHWTYLPELYDYTWEDGVATMHMEYIKGEKIDHRYNDIVLRFVAYTLIPEIIEWSSCQRLYPLIYSHNDIKLDNFLMSRNGRLILLDIDSWGWSETFPK